MRFTEKVLEGNEGGVRRLGEALEHIAYLEKWGILEDLKIPTFKLGSALADSSSSDAGKPHSIATVAWGDPSASDRVVMIGNGNPYQHLWMHVRYAALLSAQLPRGSSAVDTSSLYERSRCGYSSR